MQDKDETKMDRTKIYFKDEIRRSFILYALGPAVGFAFVVISKSEGSTPNR